MAIPNASGDVIKVGGGGFKSIPKKRGTFGYGGNKLPPLKKLQKVASGIFGKWPYISLLNTKLSKTYINLVNNETVGINCCIVIANPIAPLEPHWIAPLKPGSKAMNLVRSRVNGQVAKRE